MKLDLFAWPRTAEARRLLGSRTEPCRRYAEALNAYLGGTEEAMAELLAGAREEISAILHMGGCLDAPV